MGTGSLSQGYKAAGAWSCHPPQSSAEVKEWLQLYLYVPLSLHGLLQSELTSSLAIRILPPEKHFRIYIWKSGALC